MIPATTAAGVVTYAWPFAKDKGGYVAIAIVYGYAHYVFCRSQWTDRCPDARISSGVFVSMLAAPLIEMGDRNDVGVRLGMFFTIIAMGALAGPPISGAINTATDGYKAVGYYAGTQTFPFQLDIWQLIDWLPQARRSWSLSCCLSSLDNSSLNACGIESRPSRLCFHILLSIASIML